MFCLLHCSQPEAVEYVLEHNYAVRSAVVAMGPTNCSLCQCHTAFVALSRLGLPLLERVCDFPQNAVALSTAITSLTS